MLRPFLAVLALLTTQALHAAEKTIEFNRDVRPILSNNCFVCHGPDNNLRKGKLRLDLEKDAFADRGDYKILVPGKPEESEFYKRLVTHDKNERMPPAKSKKELTRVEIDLLREWIKQGAKYQNHWSLEQPRKFEIPAVKNPGWVRNPIDAFVLTRLEKEGIPPAPEADRRTLIRRLYVDLIGLPPSPGEVDAFVAESSPRAYENLVDRLLANKHFGERMALYWLDLVRYADTGGYHSDNHRDVYLYRDWVIDAFNTNMPFHRFTVEQLAGDLLPGATNSQKIASGYNRLLQTTEEGGAQAKEYQAKYYADRVRNLSTVWLGLTLGCTECHDHKYDPFSTKEFYSLASFFADIQEKSVGRQTQTPIMTPEIEQKVQAVDGQMAPLRKILDDAKLALVKNQARWEEEIRLNPVKDLPKDIQTILAQEPEKRNAKQKEALSVYYRSIDPGTAEPSRQLASLQQARDKLLKNVPTTLITTSGTPKTLRILPRGNWLDDTGEIVQPQTPASLPTLTFQGKRASRLDLANWLVDGQNPLTARVFVNRLWMLYFGQGIVKTLDDLGAQGAWPTHPELLDWLAVDFQEKNWDMKAAIRQMVTSNTYRQASQTDRKVVQRDPYNQLLARQARFRLDVELIRDNALAVSGLLVPKIGGPSAKPYQPAGYWAYLNFPKRDWVKDTGENQYRRGLYTYWQRSFLHPSLLAFDASTREECTAERPRSNTPQQALVLLNDPTYVEAARVFAERILKKGGPTAADRIQYAFREALQRPARAEEAKVLVELVQQHQKQYEQDPKSAENLLKIGDWPADKALPAAELAAWTSAARVIFNLHEAITRN